MALCSVHVGVSQTYAIYNDKHTTSRFIVNPPLKFVLFNLVKYIIKQARPMHDLCIFLSGNICFGKYALKQHVFVSYSGTCRSTRHLDGNWINQGPELQCFLKVKAHLICCLHDEFVPNQVRTWFGPSV